jgi:hypothetical protein
MLRDTTTSGQIIFEAHPLLNSVTTTELLVSSKAAYASHCHGLHPSLERLLFKRLAWHL